MSISYFSPTNSIVCLVFNLSWPDDFLSERRKHLCLPVSCYAGQEKVEFAAASTHFLTVALMPRPLPGEDVSCESFRIRKHNCLPPRTIIPVFSRGSQDPANLFGLAVQGQVRHQKHSSNGWEIWKIVRETGLDVLIFSLPLKVVPRAWVAHSLLLTVLSP